MQTDRPTPFLAKRASFPAKGTPFCRKGTPFLAKVTSFFLEVYSFLRIFAAVEHLEVTHLWAYTLTSRWRQRPSNSF